MSTELEQNIRTFEQEYAAKLRRWAGFVDPDELDELIETLKKLDLASNAITARFESRQDPLYLKTWQPMLKDLMGLVPNIVAHVEAIRSSARQHMGALDKGQRGLVGYRSTVARGDGVFERDA